MESAGAVLLNVLDVVMTGATVQSASLLSWLFARPNAAAPASADQHPILVGESPAGQNPRQARRPIIGSQVVN